MVGLSKRKSAQICGERNKPIPNQPSLNSKPQSIGESSNGCFLVTLSIGILLGLILLLNPAEDVVAVTAASEVEIDGLANQESAVIVNTVAGQNELDSTELKSDEELLGSEQQQQLTASAEVARIVENMIEQPKEEEVTKEIVDEELLNDWCATCMWHNSEWMCKHRVDYLVNTYHTEANEARLSLLKQGLCSKKDSDNKGAGTAETVQVDGTTKNTIEQPKLEEEMKEIVDEELLKDWCPTCMWYNTKWQCKRRMAYLVSFYHIEANDAMLSLLKQGLCSKKDSDKKTGRRLLRNSQNE